MMLTRLRFVRKLIGGHWEKWQIDGAGEKWIHAEECVRHSRRGPSNGQSKIGACESFSEEESASARLIIFMLIILCIVVRLTILVWMREHHAAMYSPLV